MKHISGADQGYGTAAQRRPAQAGTLVRQQQGRLERVSGGRTATGGRSPWEAQIARKAAFAKPLRGFRDAGVLEIVDDFDGDTFRAVYTIRFAKAVYVLHAFQKKSRRGIATPKAELGLIEQRLKRARGDYEQWSKSEKPKSR